MNNKRKDKVGIATIVGQANYGNRLQNYALDSVLRNLGFDTVTFNETLGQTGSKAHFWIAGWLYAAALSTVWEMG